MQTQWMLRLAALAAVAVITAPAQARAQNAQTQTTLTLTVPAQIPGTTLPAGTYVFETTAGQHGRQTVRIQSADRSKLVATAEVVPMKRDGALTELVQLRPTILGSAPTALKGWLPSSSGDGFQFVYSTREAADIANRTDTPVVATTDEGGKEAQLVVIDAYGQRAPWQPTS
jgi:hypothetical protein